VLTEAETAVWVSNSGDSDCNSNSNVNIISREQSNSGDNSGNNQPAATNRWQQQAVATKTARINRRSQKTATATAPIKAVTAVWAMAHSVVTAIPNLIISKWKKSSVGNNKPAAIKATTDHESGDNIPAARNSSSNQHWQKWRQLTAVTKNINGNWSRQKQ